MKRQDFEGAVAIATAEINARKGVRDYWCVQCPNSMSISRNRKK